MMQPHHAATAGPVPRIGWSSLTNRCLTKRVFYLMVTLTLSALCQSVLAQPPLIYEGFTEARRDVMVSGVELGRITSIYVKVGDRVHAGDVIARLDDQLQASSVKIARLHATMRGERDAAAAERDLQLSRTETLRKLTAQDMARPDELSRAETDLRIASARLASAEEQLKLRQLELQRYEIQLQRRLIVAPMTGVVAKVLREPGEYITPGDPVIIRLIDTSTLEALVNVPAEEIGAFFIGTAVRVFLRGSGQTVGAQVSSIAPVIDGESGTIQVRVTLDNAEGKLWPGDRCTLRLARGEPGPQRSAAGPVSGTTLAAGPASRTALAAGSDRMQPRAASHSLTQHAAAERGNQNSPVRIGQERFGDRSWLGGAEGP